MLVVDDGSNWVKGLADQFTFEGVPHTKIVLADPARPTITPGFLSSGSRAFFNAVVLPDDVGGGLPASELAALTAFEAQFGVRQVDAFTWANPTIGLNYATNPGYIGDLTGMTGTVTPAAQSSGFGYLSGTLPIGVGTYGYLATPAGPGVMPPGGTFTPFITVPIPGSTEAGTLVGVYRNGGVEKLVITGAMMTTLSHFRLMAHGIVSWVTRGVHFGHNRNYMTFQFDDTFSYDARWDVTNNCTPGEDCPSSVTTSPPPIRMTPDDVAAVVSWQQANDYRLTMPFNAYHTEADVDGNPWPAGGDPLTNAFVANKSEFIWLNHGYEHIYQGCVQDFTVVPWRCTTTNGQPPSADGSNIQWVSQAAIASEISTNISKGQALGLSFDPTEYLSGEHSGLYLTPQQPTDNPNFAAALAGASMKFIGADASREPGARVVGGATTVPRHPVAIYYNVSTVAEEVDEYNWFYTTRADGGSGYCEDNPATATCLAAPLTVADFASYIVPTDSANDLRFILSNDPRPFYAHVSNLTGPDYLGLALIDSILGQYRTAFTADTPLVNLTLTQASDVLTKQQNWAEAGMGTNPTVTGYLQDGTVVVTNPGGVPVPLTVPAGTTVDGTPFGSSYGGELSGWLTGDASLTVLGASITSPATAAFVAGAAGSFRVTTASNAGVPSLAVAGTIPAGLTFSDDGDGSATLAGTPDVGSVGSYPLTITVTTPGGSTAQTLTVAVNQLPAVTSQAGAAATVGSPFSFQITTSGTPAPSVTATGTLPAGISLSPGPGGTATLSGTPATGAAGSYPLTLTAANAAGTATQAFTLTVAAVPAFTSAATTTAAVGQGFAFRVTTTGSPLATVSQTGALPAGVTFTPGSDGSATIAGIPTSGSAGRYAVTLVAANASGSTTQAFTLVVNGAPAFTSEAGSTAVAGRPFSFTVTTTGQPVAAISRTGGLPSGITFTPGPNGTATLAGTPASTVGRVFPLTFTARSSLGVTTQSFTLTVVRVPAITSSATGTATVGAAFTKNIATSGFPAPTVTVSGLPSGLTFTANATGGGSITGTPAAATGGVYQVSVSATNSAGTATQTLALTVRQAPAVISAPAFTAVRGEPFTFAVSTSGFPQPNLTVTGTLPAGVSFQPNGNGTATISGTAGVAGIFRISIRANNAVGPTVVQSFVLTVT